MEEVLVTERGVNIHIYPFKKSDKVKVIENKGERVFIGMVGHQWDYNCFRFMDFISTVIRNAFDRHYLEQGITPVKSSHDSRLCRYSFLSNPTHIQDLQLEFDGNPGFASKDLICAYNPTFDIPIKTMLKSKCLKGMDNSFLRTIIERTSSCMMRYKYQFLSESIRRDNGLIKHDYSRSHQSDTFETFFNFKFIPGDVGKNGKLYNSRYKFSFNTILGALFLHNLFTGGYCLIKEPFYSLSKDANMVFRKRFLPWSNMTTTLKMETVVGNLGLNWKNKTMLNKKFKDILDELVGNKLIKIEKVEKGLCGTLYKTKKI
ncbi:hypothetical protein KAR91_21930 [Candidatus Pacearchaeota archaeon]|nr:hypothetical protein [Candidatus Pacearchaeota archaeon]